MQPLLGTFVEIGVNSDFPNCELAVDQAFHKIRDVHKNLSFQSKDSELTVLNNSLGRSIKLSRNTVTIIRLGKIMTRFSNCYFNCTVGNYFSDNVSIQFAGDDSDISIDGHQVKLNSNIRIILDGIAKGFAVDLAICSLKKSGATQGWVNAGGDLRVFGNNEWPVFVKGIDGKTRVSLKLRNAAIATSNVSMNEVSERFPSRVIPSFENELEGGTWSVVAKTAWRADCLTKVAANAPFTQRVDIVRRLGGELLWAGG
ncbi:MAG: FAD:protein FMN transferase [Bdellovibrionaceae bacterium]|nr:FAD:protein FMN transferase [Pseudobdellovibrionaceae bacterium]